MTWLCLFLIVPLAFVAIYGFSWYDDAYKVQLAPPDPSNYLDALRLDPGAIVLPLLVKTFAVALLSTIVSLAVGYCIAYFVARVVKEERRGIVMALIIIPFWVSFIVRIYSVLNFQNQAFFFHAWLREIPPPFDFLRVVTIPISDFILWFFKIGTLTMVVFTLMYVWLPFMVLPLFSSLTKLDPQLLEAASDLGASRWRAFLTVTLPLTFPAMVVGSILVFITSVGAFVETEMVGGSQFVLIGNYVQNQFSLTGGIPQACASALFIIVVTILLINVYRRYAELEETGSTEVQSVLRSLFSRLRRASQPPQEPVPMVSAMQDGGTPAMAPVAYQRGPIRKARWETTLDVITERAGKYLLGAFTVLMLLLLFVPLIIVAVFSFNSQDDLNVFHGFSMEWWVGSPTRDGLLQDPVSQSSIIYSFAIAGSSSTLAVLFGLLAAYALTRFRFRGRSLVSSGLYLGLVIPSIVLGVSIAILIRFLNEYLLAPLSMGYGAATPFQWSYGLASVVVGHTTFNIPLATLVLSLSLREFDRSLEEASMNLGADEVTTFLRVTLPNIAPGILSAILLGFTFSFDELPVTLFLAGNGVVTVPMVIYGLITKKIISPRVNAMSTIVLALSFVFVLVATKLGKGSGKLFRM